MLHAKRRNRLACRVNLCLRWIIGARDAGIVVRRAPAKGQRMSDSKGFRGVQTVIGGLVFGVIADPGIKGRSDAEAALRHDSGVNAAGRA